MKAQEGEEGGGGAEREEGQAESCVGRCLPTASERVHQEEG